MICFQVLGLDTGSCTPNCLVHSKPCRFLSGEHPGWVFDFIQIPGQSESNAAIILFKPGSPIAQRGARVNQSIGVNAGGGTLLVGGGLPTGFCGGAPLVFVGDVPPIAPWAPPPMAPTWMLERGSMLGS
jgi:hypothetical protein